MVRRFLVLAYGTASYALSFVSLLYVVGFVGGFLAPTQLDGPRHGSVGAALTVDVGLMAVFALQHSGMARPAFKRWWARYVPEVAERSTYVLFASLALLLLFWYWRPIGGVVWTTDDVAARVVLGAAFGAGWLLVLAATCLIDHFDLFGLRQTWLYFRGIAYTQPHFATPALYRVVRHPLYLGLLLGFWATPRMTVSHLVFAGVLTAYILTAIRWEERDLENAHPEYAGYRRRVPMLIPQWPGTARTRPG